MPIMERSSHLTRPAVRILQVEGGVRKRIVVRVLQTSRLRRTLREPAKRRVLVAPSHTDFLRYDFHRVASFEPNVMFI
jgi:hypothetical protein